ncbi:SulP family inorganic anion transporter [Hominenteromicrobium sp.]|uniref:SulP family inorganic anion transporter n=1 Tax=Hominenteromicrobium sp. TaxID=3073581 RepID=UPI003AB7D9F4
MIKNYLASLKQEFSGYNTAKLMKDIMAGLTVCAVALPLALAFGVSSGATAAAGLVTAIIAGVVIAVLGGASFQISGPTGDERRFGGHCGVLRLAGRVFRVLCGGRTAAFSRYF